MDQEERIIKVYLCIEEVYNKLTKNKPLRRGGFAPALSDAEVLTMEIIGELEGKNGDRAIWRYFYEHWHSWFPNLSSYKTFAKQCANLTWIKQLIFTSLFPLNDNVHITDGVPLPICHNKRAYQSKMLQELTSWGFCAAKEEHYYGVKGFLTINLKGFINSFIVTSANIDERLSLYDLIGGIKGLLIGDMGFLGQEYKEIMANHGIDLQTPMRKNMEDTRNKKYVKTLMYIRKSVETALSVLTTKFSITKIKAHDIWHFTSKLYRKIIAYNFYIMLKC